MKRIILKKLSTYFFLLIGVLLVSCYDSIKKNQNFKSDFSSTQKRTWVGPEYWTNPLQDWQIFNGELECLVSKPDRNIHILTKKLDSAKGSLQMNVGLTLFEVDTKKNNWVGFSIGSRGEFNDYRDNAVFGKGLNVGVSTRGNLFIDKLPANKGVNVEVQKMLLHGVILETNLQLEENEYKLIVSLKSNSGELISTLTKNNVSPKLLIGDLVLVSHFNYVGEKANKKSVSFRNWEISGSKISRHDDYTFGPILFSQYTLSKGALKMTAQMAPVILNGEKVRLQIKEGRNWKTIKKNRIDKDARTATFRIENWNVKEDIPYRLAYKIDKGKTNLKEDFYWEGTIKKEPTKKEEIVIAGFTGNDHAAFPNTDIVSQVRHHNPDVLFFSGDQIYEPTGGYGVQRFPEDKAMLDYLRKWYLYGWAFRDLMKDRPTVSIVDDHDVYHGNIWGAGGRNIPDSLGQGANAQDYGGYKMPSKWVNMVERTQTSHLPDAFDSTRVKQGIGVYYTDMAYGGISFAITEDRKFKSAPKGLLTEANIQNGWALNKSFEIKSADLPEAKLLGERQLEFLNTWVSDWSYQSEMKVLLSQTIFNNVATLPEEATSDAVVPTLRVLEKGKYPPNDIVVSDFDSNGWPQAKRDKAVRIIRKGFVFHLAGDQHLGSTIQYGVDEWNDAGFAFCVPSIANHWPRRWFPMHEGNNRHKNQPKYTGEFKDGFGNKMNVFAVSNPIFTGKLPSKVYDRAAGYGIVRLNKKTRDITIECWPLGASPQDGDDTMYDGWPITINQEQNYGRKAHGYLPEVQIRGLEKPVIEIINENTGILEYSLRWNKKMFIPKVFDSSSTYRIRIGEPDTNTWQSKKGVTVNSEKNNFNF